MSTSARLIQVIHVVHSRGKGTDLDPMRLVTSYHSTDGGLIAEVDPEKSPDDSKGLLRRALECLTPFSDAEVKLTEQIESFLKAHP